GASRRSRQDRCARCEGGKAFSSMRNSVPSRQRCQGGGSSLSIGTGSTRLSQSLREREPTPVPGIPDIRAGVNLDAALTNAQVSGERSVRFGRAVNQRVIPSLF